MAWVRCLFSSLGEKSTSGACPAVAANFRNDLTQGRKLPAVGFSVTDLSDVLGRLVDLDIIT
jgi:hypothetical protein